jgi:hypothetical protein
MASNTCHTELEVCGNTSNQYSTFDLINEMNISLKGIRQKQNIDFFISNS